MATDNTYKAKLTKGVSFEVLKSCGRAYLYVKQDCTQKYIVNFATMPCKRVNEIRKYVDLKLSQMGEWDRELNEEELKSRWKGVSLLRCDLACGGHYEVWNPNMRNEAGLKPLC